VVPGESTGNKILTDAGDQHRLYNPGALLSRHVYLCEGEPDTLSVEAVGGSALGLPGVDSWNPTTEGPWSRALRWRQVTILADNDDDGQGLDFAKRVARSLDGARILLMPKGHDVNSYLVESGPDELRRYIGLDR
jgi:hypothetical protein